MLRRTDEVSYPVIPPEDDDIDLRRLWEVPMERRGLIVTCFVIIVSLTLIVSLAMEPWYLGTATLQIESDSPKIIDFNELMQVDTTNEAFYQTQYMLIESRSLASRVILAEGLLENPDFMQGESSSLFGSVTAWLGVVADSALEVVRGPRDAVDAAALAASANVVPSPTVDHFLSNLTVIPIRNTRLVRIQWRSTDPLLAANVTNAVAREYVDMNLEAKYETTAQASEFLAAEIARLEQEISEGEAELQTYGIERDILSTDERQDTVTRALNDLGAEFTRAQSDRVEKQAYFEQLQNSERSSIPEVLANPLIVRLKTDLATLQSTYGELTRQFTEDWPEVQRVQAQISETETRIGAEEERIFNGLVTNARNEYNAARDREDRVATLLADQREQAARLNRDLISYRSLQMEIDNNKQLLDTLRERQSETGVSARLQGMAASNIRVVDPAAVPMGAYSPNIRLNLALAAAFGLMLGVALAFTREYLDNTLKSTEDIERRVGVPSLSMIPAIESLKGGHAQRLYGIDEYTDRLDKDARVELVSAHHPRSALAEAYRSLRTAVMLSRSDVHPQVILVTSSLPGEGKTTSALNLAVSFAQAGKRVLLLDADLRRPRLHELLRLDPRRGLVHYLTGNTDNVKRLVQRTETRRLWALPCGPKPPNPAELLASERAENLLSELRKLFEIIVIDSAPVMAVVDPLVLMQHTDGVAFVVKGGDTPHPVVNRAVRKINSVHGRILGAVLNNLDAERTGLLLLRSHP